MLVSIPPTPDQNVYHARTHFREERGYFLKVGANSRNQEKGVILQAKIGEILVYVLVVSVCVCVCVCVCVWGGGGGGGVLMQVLSDPRQFPW